jgi:uncharacterized protein involved in outer membrane biogenesis
MKKLFKWMFRLILALLLLVLVLVLFLDQIAKSLTERELRSQTGLEVTIGRVSIGLRKPTLTIENLKLVNSSDFGGSTFLDIPELYAQYDLSALRSWKIHLNLVRFNLGELHIVQNKDGKTNLQALEEHRKQESPSSSSVGSKAEFEVIDTLKLTVGRLKFTSEKNSADNEEVYVGLKNETLKNVKSLQDLQPLAARIALEKGIKFLSGSVFNQRTNALENATKPVEKEAGKTPATPTEPLEKK